MGEPEGLHDLPLCHLDVPRQRVRFPEPAVPADREKVDIGAPPIDPLDAQSPPADDDELGSLPSALELPAECPEQFVDRGAFDGRSE